MWAGELRRAVQCSTRISSMGTTRRTLGLVPSTCTHFTWRCSTELCTTLPHVKSRNAEKKTTEQIHTYILQQQQQQVRMTPPGVHASYASLRCITRTLLHSTSISTKGLGA